MKTIKAHKIQSNQSTKEIGEERLIDGILAGSLAPIASQHKQEDAFGVACIDPDVTEVKLKELSASNPQWAAAMAGHSHRQYEEVFHNEMLKEVVNLYVNCNGRCIWLDVQGSLWGEGK